MVQIEPPTTLCKLKDHHRHTRHTRRIVSPCHLYELKQYHCHLHTIQSTDSVYSKTVASINI